jgi:hypothetical protein
VTRPIDDLSSSRGGHTDVSEYESPMNISLNAVLRRTVDNRDRAHYWTGAVLVEGIRLQCRLERVVDSFAMKSEHVVCLISIKSVYSFCLCMYSSVQVSLSSLDTPPYPSVISRGVVGGVLGREKAQRLVSCNFVYSKQFVSSIFLSGLNTLSPGKIDSEFRVIFSS